MQKEMNVPHSKEFRTRPNVRYSIRGDINLSHCNHSLIFSQIGSGANYAR